MAADPPGLVLSDQCHAQHELAWASVGRLHVTVGRTLWTLTDERALWVPAGVVHDVAIEPGALALPVWFEPVDRDLGLHRPTPVALSPDLRDRLHRYHQRRYSGLVAEPAERAALLDLIERQVVALLPPLLPRHPQAREVAIALLRDPADRRTLARWARELSVASKTLQRAFVGDTGQTFSRWRTEVRLAAGLELLAAGRGVGEVSRAVGYDTPGGFIDAHRRRFGHTPTAYRPERPRVVG